MEPNLKRQRSPFKILRIFFLILFLGSLLALGGIFLYPLVTPAIPIQPTVTPPPTVIHIPTGASTHMPPTNIPTGTSQPTFTSVPQLFTPGPTTTPGLNPTAAATSSPTIIPTATQTLPSPTVIPTLTALPSTGGGEPAADNPAFSIITGPLFTALLGLLGFFSTTVLQWRKEARDARIADLERRQLELEYEKKKRELEKPAEQTQPRKPKDGGQARSPAAKFKGLTGEAAGKVYSLNDGAVIGRSSESALRLSDPVVSRQHARLRYGGNRWFIQDMQSAAGIFVNGKRVEAAALKNGDRVRVGKVEFEFRE